MRHRHVGQLALLSVLVLACQYLGAEPSPTPSFAAPSVLPPTTSPSASLNEETEPPSPAPSDTPMPTATLTPSPVVAPFSPIPVDTINDPTTKNIDQFWQQFLELSCVEMGMEDYWGSVTQMSKDVEVVVVGHPISVSVRYDENAGPTGVVSIEVDDVLKGDPVTQQPGVIDINDEGEGSWTAGSEIDWPHAPIANAPTLLFLRNEAKSDDRYGLPVQAGDEYLYYMPGVHQNVLTEVDGKVYVPQTPRMTKWYGDNFFPLPLSGMSWDKLLDQVRNAIASGGSPDALRHGVRAAC